MKSIAIISDSAFKRNRPSNVGEIIKNNITEVLSDKVKINNYYVDELTPEVTITDDLVILMARSRVLKIKHNVPNTDNIIIAKRTFLKKSIHQLYKIPKNKDVLVVNDNIETVLETVSTLYNIGVKHINLIPYEKNKNYSHINYAITPSEPEFIPEHIQHVFDVKNRVLDIPTMLLIINNLSIDDKSIHQNLYNYYQKIFSSNDAITQNYSNFITRSEELDYLLDLSHDGILLTDESGKILIGNKKFKEIFNLNETIENRVLHDLLPEINFKAYYNDKVHSDLINYKKKFINLEKKDVIHITNEKRIYFNFQEVTYIKKLEQNLSQKLRQKGHIARYTFDDIVYQSNKIEKIIEMSKKIAKTDLTILITGESGTGKEVLAQAIHNYSSRAKQPFIAINSAAIPENLLESELFGYSSGSFTGASKKGKKGLFEKANNGTIFLDEIGDMPKHLQSKLLRVLQEQQITPVGSDKIIDIDVRIIAATHNDPLEMIKLGKFRKDLFYRLNVFSIELPPLRERIEDVTILLNHFTHFKYTCSTTCKKFLTSYEWPGNVRELDNVGNYINTLEEEDVITIKSLPSYLINQHNKTTQTIKHEEKYYDERSIIQEKSDFSTFTSILRAIGFLNSIDKTAGRKHIQETLMSKSIELKIHLLRKNLSLMADLGFIIRKKGRAGSYLTKKGEIFLREIN
jgi:transcriptional regulator with PAS, ATPase and Fis domain